MTPENESENIWITPEQAQKELGVGESQYYVRTKELGIKSTRIKGKAYLSQEQMQKLREYSQAQSVLATVDNSSEMTLEIPFETNPISEEISSEEQEDIWRKAGEIKANHLTARDLLALHIAAGLEFKDLDPDLQERVREINLAANPQNMGKSIAGTAQAMIEKRRLSQK